MNRAKILSSLGFANGNYVTGYIFGGIAVAFCPSRLWWIWIVLVPTIGALVSELVDREFFAMHRTVGRKYRPMSREIAEKIVDAIIANLSDRRGLRSEWDQIDDEIKTEIRDKWITIAERVAR